MRSLDLDTEDAQFNSISEEFDQTVESHRKENVDEATLIPEFNLRRNNKLLTDSPIAIKPPHEDFPVIDGRMNMTTLIRIADEKDILRSDGTVNVKELCSGEKTSMHCININCCTYMCSSVLRTNIDNQN